MTKSYMKIKILSHIVGVVALLSLGSCFTGVENTPKITDKDVSRTISELERRQPSMSLTARPDSLLAWKQGKKFFVTDNQARLIFATSSSYDIDSINLTGKQLSYTGYEQSLGLDNRQVVTINFTDGTNVYSYRTGKTIDEFTSSFSIPLLVDMDMVIDVASSLEGKEVYIKTSIWYNLEKEHMFKGRQFIKVRITKVAPGNKILPLKVVFRPVDDNQEAFVWMSIGKSTISNRDYDSMFSSRDIHLNYPDITDEHWALIVNGDVTIDMTKEECRLAKGAPKTINRMPNQSDIREYWYYDGGSYLQFVDGLLKAYRK